MQRTYLFFLLALLTALKTAGQKREFRAAWIATVSNIDWPSRPGLPAVEQQQQFLRRLDQLQAIGANTVIVQIRPAADAFYPSAIEPWSRYLTGQQGQPPFPYYDPLQFMIDETHKRHMEFHAWFNPFRALTDSKKNPNPASHITRTHPQWIVSYGDKSYLNPGVPEAREYVTRVIADVVKRYDVDAVHLDDYFYPYRIAGKAFNDAAAFAAFSNGIADREDWRRNNVSLFILNLNNSIKSLKPYVKLGISPFGVWRNYSRDTAGSRTRGGQTDYDDLYADVRLWLEKGWIDYAMPQLYWEHGHRAAPFDVLMPWWRDHAYGRHVYFGLGLYRMLNTYTGTWGSTRELTAQISDIRHYAPETGFALYSLSNLDRIFIPIRDSLAAYGRYIAFPPPMRWLDSTLPSAPMAVKAVAAPDGNLVQWQHSNPKGERMLFAVYRFRKSEPVNLEDNRHILALTDKKEFIDPGGHTGGPYIYAVTALSRLWNESKAAMATPAGQ